LQGQVIETELFYILTLDYNKFRELFQSSKDKKEEVKRKKRNKETVLVL
jgi:hypothetical protein